jgi:hypothetical protein
MTVWLVFGQTLNTKPLFQKPASKALLACKVAIKVSCLNTIMMPKVAIINKVADELLKLGVPYTNMIIYDGCSNATGVDR